MTTAARPTFEPAQGGRGKGEGDLSALSKQYSSRDLPGHTKLKTRQPGQGTVAEQRGREYRKELEERERTAREKRERGRTHDSVVSKRARIEQSSANLDADDPIDDDEDEDTESEDEDDTAELLAELNRIKKERAAETAAKEAEKKAEEERIRMENILRGNPLINQSEKSDFKVKRRWDDDVVFKNCAKDDTNKEKRFINDTLRSEFHKKFMDKYVK
ncbi:hypothetical protein NP493_56g09007 [Ridgeia piscesae]|uniref:Cwf15/Cwc15 cell cycle control protein n=1 Tax=Ridgeia piscesae TaxID=27915 RepID=A0AAD9PAZ4_RIDPI|nr:hypothetical protein NP493_56g09007 [Ridgeia piscesae]